MFEKQRLIEKRELGTADSLEDTWYEMAYAIESSLQNAGANKRDYTLMELFSLAQPFVLETWKDNNKKMDFDRAFEKTNKSPSLNP